ncbi:hypothetical protein [Flavobacterium defluvii]|uniref:Lipoprotein n=1 Tax=Flavobacterium defluvii TaxID=370979 RepID=A0A1M5IP34_9FLAO|nr:hypothetical protein [Flavobacterium defluvii]SHG30005.1 hypothetical protein SAMN05443663_102465 [Flavobacterium defluvii]
MNLFKSNIVIVLMLTAFLFSCKNNQDGYSDEIETTTATDSTKGADSTGTNETGTNKSTGDPNTGAASTTPNKDLGKEGTKNGGTGTGIGPGEDAQDGATYTSSSKKQNADKDSVTVKSKKR